ncbi:hypothetical protein JYU20_02370, partial [Bacteroidales bacterium AH-315-I05]|nr:hypothetical protein [Bacteroidales bacterium AH-315-I05]
EQLGFPFFYAGSVINYSISSNKLNYQGFPNEKISFELFDGSEEKEALVKDIITKSCIEDPVGFYKTPYLNRLISKQLEAQYLADYYSQFKTPDKPLFFVKEGDVYMGLVCYILDGDTADSPLAAIYPKMRNRGALKHIKIERFNFALKKDYQYTVNGARIDNLASQHVFEGVGMKKKGIDHIFHILPFLSKAKNKVVIKIASQGQTNKLIIEELRKRTSGLHERFTRVVKITDEVRGGHVNYEIRFPVLESDLALCVVKIVDAMGVLALVSYHGFER